MVDFASDPDEYDDPERDVTFSEAGAEPVRQRPVIVEIEMEGAQCQAMVIQPGDSVTIQARAIVEGGPSGYEVRTVPLTLKARIS